MTLARRILFTTIAPLIGLGVASAALLHDAASQHAASRLILQSLESAPILGGLVHELQKERGLSAGFIGSRGEKFRDALGEQRAHTDDAHGVATGLLEGLQTDPALSERSTEATASLSRLGDVRQAVDVFALTPPEMAAFYTGVINHLLFLAGDAVQRGSDGAVVRLGSAYAAVLKAKENAGLQRAMGAIGFGSGQFSPQIHQRFIALGAAQRTLLQDAMTLAGPQHAALFEEALDSPVIGEFEALEEIAAASVVSGDHRGVTGPQWFEVSTARIDLKKGLEDSLASALAALATANAETARRSMFAWGASLIAAIAACLGFAWISARRIAKPIKSMSTTMEQLARGELDVEVSGAGRKDEIGDMAAAVSVFKENAIEKVRLEAEQEELAQSRAHAKREEMNVLAARFEAEVGSIAQIVTSAANDLQGASDGLTTIVEATQNEAQSASDGADQASASVQSVSAAVEEMSASIEEVNHQLTDAAARVRTAAEGAQNAEDGISELVEALASIDAIVAEIAEVARETNLLALNATIEAARAGPAGYGFAVVAAQVKQLARSTGEMTNNISEKISSVHEKAERAVEASRAVLNDVGEIHAKTDGVAGSMSEQSNATALIAQNTQEAALGTQSVSGSLVNLTDTARQTVSASDSVARSAEALNRQARELRTGVESFLERVRAA